MTAAIKFFTAGDLTNAALSLLDTLSRSQPLTEDANERLKKTLKLVVGFFAGCIAGAAAVSWFRDSAWLPAVVLAGVAVALRKNRFPIHDATASAS